MNKITKITFFFLIASLILGSAFTQKVVDTPEQAKLMAKRAAQVDAYRNLSETIYGLEIDSTTTVKDFVTQNDIIKTRLNVILRGAKVVDERYKPDGTCEVDVEISVMALQRALRRPFVYEGEFIRATGYGVSNPVKEPTPQEEPFKAEPEWTRQTFKATGSGVPPADKANTAQGKLLAARAAKADALRNLAETIKGVQVTSETYVRDFVTKSDRIKTRFEAFVQGAVETDRRFLDDGTCEVDVEIDLLGLDDILEMR